MSSSLTSTNPGPKPASRSTPTQWTVMHLGTKPEGWRPYNQSMSTWRRITRNIERTYSKTKWEGQQAALAATQISTSHLSSRNLVTRAREQPRLCRLWSHSASTSLAGHSTRARSSSWMSQEMTSLRAANRASILSSSSCQICHIQLSWNRRGSWKAYWIARRRC